MAKSTIAITAARNSAIAAHLQGRARRRASADADVQAFLACEPASHRLRIFGVHADDFIGELRVINLRYV